MWQRIPVLPPGLATETSWRAFEVLLATARNFGTLDHMHDWMRREQARLFYFRGTGFELVFGFRPGETAATHRAIIGWNGDYSPPALRSAVREVLEIARAEGVLSLTLSLLKLPASDPLRAVFQRAATEVEQAPGVSLQATDQGNRTRYVATISAQAPATSR